MSEKVEKTLSRIGKFRILTREQRAALLNELKLDLQGITKKSETKLLESSDGLIHIEINTATIEGKLSLKLNLRLILRDGTSYNGSAGMDKANFNESVTNATDDLMRSTFPEETDSPKQTTNWKKSPLLRSLILPGWGQWTKGQKVKSSLFFLGTIFAGAAVYSYDSKYRSIKSDLDTKNTMILFSPGGTTDLFLYSQIQSKRSELSSTGKTADTIPVFLVAFYLINVADAYFSKSSVAANMDNPYLPKTGLMTNVSSASIGIQRENYFTVEYQWGF